jgi:K319L-like, PKD domain
MAAYTAYLNQPFIPKATAFDPDAYPGIGLSVAWSQLSGPDTASFSSLNSLTPTITAPTPGLYIFQLTVSDSLTPVFLTIAVNVLPLFNVSVPYTAYCPTGSAGTPVTFTALASSNISPADAETKALNAGLIAANAALVCSAYPPLPKLQINIFGAKQIDPSINAIQLSYLSAGTLAAPLTETVLGVLNGFPLVNHPLAKANNTVVGPGNILFPYSTSTSLDIDDMLLPLTGPVNLILRAGSGGHFTFPMPLNLDAGPPGVSIGSLAAGPGIAAAPNAVLSLPNNAPGNVNVSLAKGVFIGFDTANWRPSGSPATYLLVGIPQGPLNNPTGIANLAALPMDRPNLPALADVELIHSLLSPSQLNNPLFLVFFAATYDPGSGVYTRLANSIQFSANSVFTASNSAPPGAQNPFSILSMSGVPNLNIPPASNGVLYFPNPAYARVVAGMSSIA